MDKFIRKHSLLLCLLAFHFAANLAWLLIDNTPPAWDQAAHLRIAVLFRRWMTGDGENGLIQIVRSAYGYPPLIQFIGGMWGVVAGASVDGITLLNTLFFLVSIVGVYLLGYELMKNWKWAGLGAVLFSLFPVVYDISRGFLLDLPLFMFTTYGVYFYLKSDDLRIKKYRGWFLLMFILASLTKLNGMIYFVPIFVFLIVKKIRDRKPDELLVLMPMAGIYLVSVGWWWAVNYHNIRLYLSGLAGQGEKLTDPMNLMEWQTWIHYFKLMFLHQLSPLAAMTIIVLLFGFKDELRKERRVFLWGFVLVNYLIFTIIKNKDFRFTMPILPVLAVLTTMSLRKLSDVNLKWAKVVGVGLLSYFLLIFWLNSYRWPIKREVKWGGETFLLGWVDWVNISDYPVSGVKRQTWPNKRMIGDIYAQVMMAGRSQNVLMLINIEELNDNNMLLYRDVVGVGRMMEMHSVGARDRFESDEELANYVGKFDLVVSGNREMEIAPFYATNLEAYKQAREFVLKNEAGYERLGEYKLPNGGTAYLLKRL